MKQVLVVDDDPDFSFALAHALRRQGYDVDAAHRGDEALAAARTRGYAAVLLDLGLPDCSGHAVIEQLAAIDADVPIVVLSARDEAASAVRALRAGAYHYLTKPVGTEELVRTLAQATERTELRRRLEAVTRGADTSAAEGVGRSPAWRLALDALRAAATAPRTPVLVTGESGTGKERCARLVHTWSERAQGPFVAVNAAGFAPGLLESELFGHEAGAFTGARGAKRGVFDLANGGTLFLDEVGELPLELQPKLLRVLDGHAFRRVGGERELRVDVRVVSATNRDLDAEVRAGRFRLDLFHRLRVVEVRLPPLRVRGDDVGLLAEHFLETVARDLGRRAPLLTAAAHRALAAYAWPGNVRELRNVLERVVVLCRDGIVDLDLLPREITAAAPEPRVERVPAATPGRTLEEALRAHVLATYNAQGRNLTQAARALAISRTTLRRRLREMGEHVVDADDRVS